MIDLRSDTVTTPDEAMREAAATADVGDDVYGEDPTVAELEAAVADRLGTEDALFCPSGTMCNQVAARVHADRGAEAIVDREAHVYRWELGGLAQLAGLQVRPVDGGPRGAPTAAQVREARVERDLHSPGTELLTLENTHNGRGGVALAPERIAEPAAAARELGVAVHLDGARLFNAAVAHDCPAAEFVEPVDSVSVCLSKGLGAPVGSVLAGGGAFVEAARRVRKLYGGGMRQAGLIAAPGLCALENVPDLAVDHERAAELAAGVDDLSGLTAAVPETNIVLVETSDPAAAFLERAAEAGVRGVAFGDHRVRFVTHRDLGEGDVSAALDRLAAAHS